MKSDHKDKQKWNELRKARDSAEKQFENYSRHNKDETNPVYRQLFNRMIRAQEEFKSWTIYLCNKK